MTSVPSSTIAKIISKGALEALRVLSRHQPEQLCSTFTDGDVFYLLQCLEADSDLRLGMWLSGMKDGRREPGKANAKVPPPPILQWAPAHRAPPPSGLSLTMAVLLSQPHRGSHAPHTAAEWHSDLPSPPLSCPAHGWAGPLVKACNANWYQLVPNRCCIKIKTSQGVISYFKFLKRAGDSEPSTHFGFENSIHITENVTESLKVLPSGGYKVTIPRSPEKLRLVLEEVCEAAGSAGETVLSLTSRRQIYYLEL